MDAVTRMAVYDIPAGGSAVQIGAHQQVRYVWGDADVVELTHAGKVYKLTRGAWLRAPLAGAQIAVKSTVAVQIALEFGLRDVDAVPHAPKGDA
ncbi:hypothetical protein [Tateyamaria sp.]|uniref:hypothetical protein n=1 Tax=Tateyamaria sp. TaxID=1929288 RepID=UPI003B20E45F